MAKILVFDIETTPNLAYVWGKYQQDVIAYNHELELLSFAYKWFSEKEIYAVGLNDFDEETLVLRLHQLFDEADIVIAHNGARFDVRKANAKFIEYGLTPPSPYKVVDTKIVAKRYFMFNSNKLDDIGSLLGVGRKVQTGGFSLWLGCMAGDEKAWAKMLRYNKQDVILLEKIYKKLRPWIENHPGLNIIDSRPSACPKCGHTKLQARGTRHTKVSIFRRFQCLGCGGWCQARKSIKSDVQYVN